MTTIPALAPTLEAVILLLLLASLLAAWLADLPIPYTVGLVIAGIIIDVLGLLPPTTLTPEVFLWILLPPLLFEAAFAVRWDHLAPVAPTVTLLATLGVVLSAAVTAAVMVLGLHLPLQTAALFGVLVSATDPVAVVAFFRQARVQPELRALVEGESLLNDGAAIVLVRVLTVAFAMGGAGAAVSPLGAVGEFLKVAVGGLAVGVTVGFLGSIVSRGTTEYLAETTLSVVVAYGSYLAAEELGVSGVLAVVGAGSVLGNFGRRFGMSARARDAVAHLWEFLAFITNSLVFLLLGVAVVPRVLEEMLPAIGVGVLAALFGRAVTAYGLGGLIAWGLKMPPLAWRNVLFWGGLRGALPVIVALGISAGPGGPPELRNLVLGVVVVSLLIQGLTLEPILRRTLAGET